MLVTENRSQMNPLLQTDDYQKKQTGEKEERMDFASVLMASNAAQQSVAADSGKTDLGESANDTALREQLEKITGKGQTKLKNKMEKEDYLNLFVTQLKYQDPAKPMENSEMSAQMAQFNTVEQLMGINKVLLEMQKQQKNVGLEKLTPYLNQNAQIQGNAIALDVNGKSTTAQFSLPTAAAKARVEIRNAQDAIVRTIDLGPQAHGEHAISWNGLDDSGQKAAAGRYTFRLVCEDEAANEVPVQTFYTAQISRIAEISTGGKLFTSLGPAELDKIVSLQGPQMT